MKTDNSEICLEISSRCNPYCLGFYDDLVDKRNQNEYLKIIYGKIIIDNVLIFEKSKLILKNL